MVGAGGAGVNASTGDESHLASRCGAVAGRSGEMAECSHAAGVHCGAVVHSGAVSRRSGDGVAAPSSLVAELSCAALPR